MNQTAHHNMQIVRVLTDKLKDNTGGFACFTP